MKLFLNSNPIKLEIGYELGYGPSDEIAELILAFKEDNEEVLFHFIEYDKTKDPHKAFISKMNLQHFHAVVLWDPDHKLTTRVVQALRHKSSSKEANLTDEQWIEVFRNQKLEDMDVGLKNEIQELLYDMCSKYELREYPEAVQNFIRPRVKYQNKLWLKHMDMPQHVKNVIWYELQKKEEIIKALEYTDFWFSCAIVSKGTGPEQFNSYLSYTEVHGFEPEDPDGMVMYIQIRNKERFLEKTLPKLKRFMDIEVI
nr:hypothetical protein [Paenibacillus xylanexedens]